MTDKTKKTENQEKSENQNIPKLEATVESTLLNVGITNDEIKIIEAWRFVKSRGKFMIYKNEGAISGRIHISVSH